jgi:hypothetical protein
MESPPTVPEEWAVSTPPVAAADPSVLLPSFSQRRNVADVLFAAADRPGRLLEPVGGWSDAELDQLAAHIQ